jgi:Ycf66 protein N-terminus/Clp amino terminal domain, pathogenicity island component
MLTYVLALAVALGSFVLYVTGFFFPEVHRKNDVIWSGVGLFYALVLWVCAGRITGGVLLGQTASVALLGWFGWQTLQLRRQLTPHEQQTPAPSTQELQQKLTNLLNPQSLSGLKDRVIALLSQVKGTASEPGSSPSKPGGTQPSGENTGVQAQIDRILTLVKTTVLPTIVGLLQKKPAQPEKPEAKEPKEVYVRKQYRTPDAKAPTPPTSAPAAGEVTPDAKTPVPPLPVNESPPVDAPQIDTTVTPPVAEPVAEPLPAAPAEQSPPTPDAGTAAPAESAPDVSTSDPQSSNPAAIESEIEEKKTPLTVEEPTAVKSSEANAAAVITRAAPTQAEATSENQAPTEELIEAAIRSVEQAAQQGEPLPSQASPLPTSEPEVAHPLASLMDTRNQDVFERLAETASQVLQLAQAEAQRLGQAQLDSEHLLIGLAGSESGIATQALKSVGANLSATRAEVEKRVGTRSAESNLTIVLSSNARQILERALHESRRYQSTTIEPEHVLLGLLNVEHSNAVQILQGLEANVQEIRDRVMGLLNESAHPE